MKVHCIQNHQFGYIKNQWYTLLSTEKVYEDQNILEGFEYNIAILDGKYHIFYEKHKDEYFTFNCYFETIEQRRKRIIGSILSDLNE